MHTQALDILIALSMDARTDYLQDMTNKALTKLLGDNDSETRQLREHLFVLHHMYNLIIEYTNDIQDPVRYYQYISTIKTSFIKKKKINILSFCI